MNSTGTMDRRVDMDGSSPMSSMDGSLQSSPKRRSMCRELTARIAGYVGRVLFKQLEKQDGGSVLYELDRQIIKLNDNVMHVARHVYISHNGSNRMVLLTPFFNECSETVDPLSALLFAHYLLSRAWIIHMKPTLGDSGEFIHELNVSLQEKIGALMDPYGRARDVTSADLAGYDVQDLVDLGTSRLESSISS